MEIRLILNRMMTLRKISLGLPLILLLIGVLGYQQKEEANEPMTTEKDVEITKEPTITGEITEIEDGRFLVISKTDELSTGEPDTIWFSTDDINSLEIGQTVSVWTTNINESYPGQAKADKIEIEK